MFRSISLTVAVLTGLAACQVDEVCGVNDDPSGDLRASPTLVDHVIVLGRAPASLFVRLHDDVTRLSQGALGSGMIGVLGAWRGSARATALASTSDGLQALSELVACALPAGWEVDLQVAGQDVQVLGEVGLAASWAVGPLDATARRWVTSCVAARASGSDVAVVISLRGDQPALGTSPDERDGWSIEDGAFWGDLFTPVGAAPGWVACRGTGWQASPIEVGLADRVCTQPDTAIAGRTTCGMIDAGRCDVACTRSPQGNYAACVTPAVGVAHQVISALVLP